MSQPTGGEFRLEFSHLTKFSHRGVKADVVERAARVEWNRSGHRPRPPSRCAKARLSGDIRKVVQTMRPYRDKIRLRSSTIRCLSHNTQPYGSGDYAKVSTVQMATSHTRSVVCAFAPIVVNANRRSVLNRASTTYRQVQCSHIRMRQIVQCRTTQGTRTLHGHT